MAVYSGVPAALEGMRLFGGGDGGTVLGSHVPVFSRLA